MLGTFKYWTILTHIVQYHLKLPDIVQYYLILFNIAQYSQVLFCIVQYCLSDFLKSLLSELWYCKEHLIIDQCRHTSGTVTIVGIGWFSIPICHLLYVNCYLSLATWYLPYVTCYKKLAMTWMKLVSFRSLLYVS